MRTSRRRDIEKSKHFMVKAHLLHMNNRFEAMNSINEMFSLIWKFNSDSEDKAKRLREHYPKDLNTVDFMEEIQHLGNVGHGVFGEVTYFFPATS